MVGAGFVLLDRFAPVVVARRVGTMTAKSWEVLIAEFNARLSKGREKTAIVYDVLPSASNPPDAASRKVIAEWWRKDADLLAARCAGIDCVFPSAVSRGVLTAIAWVTSPPMPIGVHSDPRAGVASAIGRTGQPWLDAGAIVSAVDALYAAPPARAAAR